MPRTIESIAENHRLATERRKAGRPIWDRRLSIRHLFPDDESDEAAKKAGREIAAVLKASPWFKADQEAHGERLGDPEVQTVMEEFEGIEDVAHLNLVLDGLYDLADADRVWIA